MKMNVPDRSNYNMVEDLIPLINKLQVVFQTTGMQEIQLPQIVVVGDQSTGKSSVLEGLVGKSFLPRGIGIVTRCPIILQLHQLKEQGIVEEWCQFDMDKDEGRKYMDFDEARQAIEEYQVKFAGDRKEISDVPIIVQVYSPHVVDLTVVDLPGIVKVATHGQSPDIVGKVHGLIMKYIENPSAIILAVSAANADIATSESIKLAKEVDPDGNRTLAVLTKLDLMDEGTDATAVLSGEVLKVKLGIIGVINRSQKDINTNLNLEEMREKETRILREKYPQVKGIGSFYLAQRLNELLKEHISRNLPDLIRRMSDLKKDCESELRNLGLPLPTKKTDCFRLIYDTTCGFIESFRKLLQDGLGGNDPVDNGAIPFPSRISETFEQLMTKIILDAEDIKDPDRLEEELRKTKNFEGYASIEKVFKRGVAAYLHRMEGPTVNCARELVQLLVLAGKKCFQDRRLQTLNNRIHEIVERLIQEQLKECEGRIRTYIEEQCGMICTTDKEFVDLLNAVTGDDDNANHPGSVPQQKKMHMQVAFPLLAWENSRKSQPFHVPWDGEEEDQPIVKYTGELIFCYLEVAKRDLCNYMPKVMYNILLTKTLVLIKDAVMNDSEGQESMLVSEPWNVTERRLQKQALFKNLQDASEVIKEIRSILSI